MQNPLLIQAIPHEDESPMSFLLRTAELNAHIVKLLYYSYKIRKKLEITHRLNRSTILYAYV